MSISCKHVHCALDEGSATATVLPIIRDVFHAMKLPVDKISAMKDCYNEAEASVPLVQRISENTFVVQTEVSRIFPAGLLHVKYSSSKEPHFVCACKKIKILLTPNHSVVMESDKCDHIIFVFAAILSSEKLTYEFGSLLPAIEMLFNVKEIVRMDAAAPADLDSDSVIDFQNLTTTIETSLTKESISMPTSTIEDLENIELIQVPGEFDESSAIVDYENVASVEQFESDSTDLHSLSFDNIRIINEQPTGAADNLDSLELIDCHVELMDQFKMAEYANEVYFGDSQVDYFDSNTIYDMSLGEWNCVQSDAPTYQPEDVLMASNDPEEQPPLTVDSPRKTQITNVVSAESGSSATKTSEEETDPVGVDFFTNWLDSVIERINLTMNFADDGCPEPLIFSTSHVTNTRAFLLSAFR